MFEESEIIVYLKVWLSLMNKMASHGLSRRTVAGQQWVPRRLRAIVQILPTYH